MSKVRLAIIGNGMVGHRFIEDLLDKADANQFDITVFCEEPRKAYDRVHLSSYFSHHTAEELSLVRDGFYEAWRESAGGRTRYHHQPSGKSDSLQRRTNGFLRQADHGDWLVPVDPADQRLGNAGLLRLSYHRRSQCDRIMCPPQ